jgi:thymidylate synthase
MKQYLDTMKRLMDEGVWVENERTGKKCLTIINADFTYHADRNEFPLVTTRTAYWKPAFREIMGYLKGFSSAAQFRATGCKTWDANANDNKAWLANPNRAGVDSMGRVYGVQLRDLRVAPTEKQYDSLCALVESGDTEGFMALISSLRSNTVDQLVKVYNNLKQGIDDRGEILTFWNAAEFDQGCLRPCMYMHHFSILDKTLYLTTTQRSADSALGFVSNMPQAYILLCLMAQITNLKVGKVFHKAVNFHLYEDQYEPMKNIQLKREPFPSPKLHINPEIKTLDDLLTWVTDDDLTVTDYQSHAPISYPFSV